MDLRLGNIWSDGIEENGWEIESNFIGFSYLNEHDLKLRKRCIETDFIDLFILVTLF